MQNNQTITGMENLVNQNNKMKEPKTKIVLNKCQKRLGELDSYLSSEFHDRNSPLGESCLNFFAEKNKKTLGPALCKKSKLNFNIKNRSESFLTSNFQSTFSNSEIEAIMEEKLTEIELEGLLEDTVLEKDMASMNLSPILDEDDLLESITKRQNFDFHLRKALLSIDEKLSVNQLSKLSDFVWSGLKLVSVSRQN